MVLYDLCTRAQALNALHAKSLLGTREQQRLNMYLPPANGTKGRSLLRQLAPPMPPFPLLVLLLLLAGLRTTVAFLLPAPFESSFLPPGEGKRAG